MGRNPKPESEHKVNFNAKLNPKHLSKLKDICAFRTVTKRVKKYSEASFVEDAISATPLKKPTAKQIAAYNKKFPDRPYTPPAE
jgi:hypothetical protein